MKSEFEKWFKTSRSYLALKEANYYDLDLFEFNESYKRYVHSGIQIAFETWQHQQAKVDELNQELEAQREETIKGYSKISELRLERDELQKRVDTAQKVADKMVKGTVSVSMFAYELEQALKGGDA